MPTRRENTRRRRPPFRNPATLILIVCGGEVTEPAYFHGLRRHVRNPATKSTVAVRPEDPKRVVTFAARNRTDYDQVWCVLDVDEFDYTDASRIARAAKIDLAVSNPCFEYWLLLHFENCDAVLMCYRDVEKRLKKHLPSYDKSALRFADYVMGVEEAMQRAKSRCVDNGDECRTNPSTGVWRLVELMTADPPEE
ncbi:RloB family protein [Nocardia amamiensis]|uniref:RloB family protein n=1 Tax=Nocardia amamiensis TaxID=404578 RepID=UPI0009FE327B|nr:RloB family protein [Nocardia amamiensis]